MRQRPAASTRRARRPGFTQSTAPIRAAVLVLYGCAMAGAMDPAHAQSPTPAEAALLDTWSLKIGAFIMNSDLRASLNGEPVDNPEVDFGQTFGNVVDAARVRGDVLWRITPAHHLRFMYFNNTVSRSKVIDKPIEWGEYTFDVGGKIDYGNRIKIFELAYEYAFLRRPSYELAASVGVHSTELNLQLSGAASIVDANGNTSNVAAATKQSRLLTPLPVVGLSGNWAAAPDWTIDAQAQYFRLESSGYEGYWSDLRLGSTWWFGPKIGAGLAYNRFAKRITVERPSFDGRVRFTYSGLQAYLTGSF